ncbi:MAG: ATP-binding cassette domain-containing protein [Desulfosarcinaceae bacterium]
MTNEEALIDIKGVSKAFPGVLALDRVDFCLRRGEVHGLMGENGAGKSTLIKVLTGLYPKDEGEVLFEGGALGGGEHLHRTRTHPMGTHRLEEDQQRRPHRHP